jgi:3-dehydroquinate synthase
LLKISRIKTILFVLQQLKIKHLVYFCTMGKKKIDKPSISTVLYAEKGWNRLENTIQSNRYTSIFILTDSNTNQHCLPLFDNHFKHAYNLLTMEAGENNKHLATCETLWASLSEKGADRNSLLINLGGGVVTDLGGFVACTYKRGIDFINIPTSLLAMVDASVGGKTGVDFQGLKNQIGIIKEPEFVVIDYAFLQMLPLDELRSGYAEMLKHGLIADADYFSLLSSKSIDLSDKMTDHIGHSVRIKSQVVTEDPFEQGLRKILNYGHTLGHAIETHFLEHPTKKRLLHGEAIAIGMIMEAELSCRTTNLTVEERDQIKTVFSSIYDPVRFEESDVISIKGLLKHDKKNQSDQVRFVLLQAIGKPVIDCLVSEEDINAAFQFYAD